MQLSIYNEVNQLKHSRKHNLNLFTLEHLRSEGFEIGLIRTEDRLVAASKIDPIIRLLEKDLISVKEYEAAKRYSEDFERCHQSNHARPTLIYQGLAHSSASYSLKINDLDDRRLASSEIVNKVREEVSKASQSRQIKHFKEFKDLKKNHRRNSKDKKLLEILFYLFEKALTIDATRKILDMHYNTLRERAQEVAAIILRVYIESKKEDLYFTKKAKKVLERNEGTYSLDDVANELGLDQF